VFVGTAKKTKTSGNTIAKPKLKKVVTKGKKK
jgi:hypothetical protein